jgi:hypothetical protein
MWHISKEVYDYHRIPPRGSDRVYCGLLHGAVASTEEGYLFIDQYIRGSWIYGGLGLLKFPTDDEICPLCKDAVPPLTELAHTDL